MFLNVTRLFLILCMGIHLFPSASNAMDEECKRIIDDLHEYSNKLSKISFTQENESYKLPIFVDPKEAEKYAAQNLRLRGGSIDEKEYKTMIENETDYLLKGAIGFGWNHYTLLDERNYLVLSGDNEVPSQYYLVTNEYFANYTIDKNTINIRKNDGVSRISSYFFTFERIYDKIKDPSILVSCEISSETNKTLLLTEQHRKYKLTLDEENPPKPKSYIEIDDQGGIEIDYLNFKAQNDLLIPTKIFIKQYAMHPSYKIKYLERIAIVKIDNFNFLPEMTAADINFEVPEGTILNDTRISGKKQAISSNLSKNGILKFSELIKK